MKKVILLGRLGIHIPDFSTGVKAKNVVLFSATNFDEYKTLLEQNNNDIDMLIMGAGIPLEIRLNIIEDIFTVSKKTTVHMKDWDSGPKGMLPFVNQILSDL